MKIKRAAGLFAAMAFAAGSASLEAQSTNLMLYNFNTDQVTDTGYGTVWGNWFGGMFGGVAWDGAIDASNNAGSGSLKLTLNAVGSDQYVLWDGATPSYSPLDLGTWTNLSFDIRYDASSAIRTNTTDAGMNGSLGPGSLDFGFMRVGSRGPSFSQDWIRYFAVSATNGAGLPNTDWTRVNVDLRQVTQNFSDLSAGLVDIIFGMDGGSYGNNSLVGPQTIWIDNIQLSGQIPNPPPPTVSIEKATPALRMFGGSGQYGRAQLQVVGGNESWIGGTFPKTYSFTVLDNATSPGALDYHMHFIQGSDGYSGADYTQPTVLWLQIISGTGTNTECVANISWKTNAPNVNPNQTSSGAVALTITNSVLAGTWTLTFDSNTSGTLTAPGASPVPFTLALSDADAVSSFSNPLELRFGIQNFGNPANGGVPHDWAKISVSGTAGLQINEDFTQKGTNQLDTAIWDLGHSDGVNLINLVPTNAPYWVKWTLPDSGFSLVQSTSLGTPIGSWDTVSNVTPMSHGGVRWVLVPGASLPNGGTSFFGLIRRTFSQLQVLLPGETNAPGTLTGKIGTPTPISFTQNGGFCDVTINAVDSTYHIINVSGDVISLSSSDSAAFLPEPAPLANGTVTQVLLFGANGTFTVTATDTTKTNIPPATSSPVTVSP